jgi:hypothetical protein
MRSVVKARALLHIGLLLGVASVASAQVPVPVPLSVSGNVARGLIELPGGIGAELTFSVEDVVGLNPTALAVFATLVNPLDAGLLSRLPGGGIFPLVTIPAGFPVLVEISPSPSSALSFAGVASVSLYTHNLQLDCLVPLALHRAHAGGPFQDIMVSEGRGSYRAGGSCGDFSEFLIVVDQRPIDTVIVGKFDAVQSLPNQHAGAIPPDVAAVLQLHLTEARTLYQAGATVAAIGKMGTFSQYVVAHSGTDIPDIWRAHDSVVNIAGLLRASADTLKFSLDRKASR